MKNQFVDYTTALRLKNLGFNDPCLFYYYGGFSLDCITEDGRPKWINHNDSIFSTCYSAPAYEQVVGWLREKKFLEILILPQQHSACLPLPLYFICIIEYKEDGEMYEVFNSTNENSLLHYSSHREATIAAINKALDILYGEKY